MEGLEVAGHRQAYQVLLPANHFMVNCVLLILDFNFMPSEVVLFMYIALTCISNCLANKLSYCHMLIVCRKPRPT